MCLAGDVKPYSTEKLTNYQLKHWSYITIFLHCILSDVLLKLSSILIQCSWFVCLTAGLSLPQILGGKDVLTALRGSSRKKPRRHKGSTGSVADESGQKARTKGLSGNRSVENIVQQMDEEADNRASESVEVTFEIRKKYNVKQFNYYCTENEKRSIRRVKSNDSLLNQRRVVVRQPADKAGDNLSTLRHELSPSRELLDDHASSAEATTSEDGRSESCSSSVLESEL